MPARTLDVVEPADPAAVGVSRLLGHLGGRDRWMVVFDNAEDPHALEPFLPRGPGKALMTSHNPRWRGVADPISVRKFARAESIALLRTLVPLLGEQEEDRVAEAVGDLPLVVDKLGRCWPTPRWAWTRTCGCCNPRPSTPRPRRRPPRHPHLRAGPCPRPAELG